MREIASYLEQIDEVIAHGPFTDSWESLKNRKIPEWFTRNKFGLFIHWGCFTVPECDKEWYPNRMYWKFTRSYNHRVKTYGKNADYREIAMQFNPQKFNADEWLDIFKQSGARHIMPVGEHHDGVKMYKSELNRWNTVDMTPKRDFMAELHESCDRHGIRFLISNHRAEHYWFMHGARFNYPQSEALKPEYHDLYGDCVLIPRGIPTTARIKPTTEWMEDWLASACEMVDVNKPNGMYFDWWIEQHEFRPYLRKFIAYYYNRASEWGIEPVVFYKYNAMMQGTAVFDVERGQVMSIAREPWQCDTSIAKNSWSYTLNNKYKSAYNCLTNLIDVVSKNGSLMLNVGPMANGEICPQEKEVLRKIGEWLNVNGEAIYDSEPYARHGEGKVRGGGAFKENIKYGKNDYRYTYKCGALYLFPLSNKARKNFSIKGLRRNKNQGMTYKINGISILGEDTKLVWKRTFFNFKIKLESKIKRELPICFRIDIE